MEKNSSRTNLLPGLLQMLESCRKMNVAERVRLSMPVTEGTAESRSPRALEKSRLAAIVGETPSPAGCTGAILFMWMEVSSSSSTLSNSG